MAACFVDCAAGSCLHACRISLFICAACLFFFLVVVVFAGAQGRQDFFSITCRFFFCICASFLLLLLAAFVFCYLCADRTLFTWQVTNMIKIFRDLDSFNYALSEEDVSRVTDMHEMFDNDNAYSFDQDLSKWDVSLVSLRHGRDVFLCSFL